MGDGTKENPYTREDVLRRIKENGDKAEGLDLSGKVFEENIDLRRLNLVRIILKKTVFLVNVQPEVTDSRGAHLEKADLRDAHLEEAFLPVAHLEEADLTGAHLEKAKLMDAHFEKAKLMDVHLEKANLRDAHLEEADLRVAHFEEAYLGNAHLEEADLRDAHLEGAVLRGAEFSPETRLEEANWGNYILGEEKRGSFSSAADTYRRLKMWHTNAGIYDIAGKFFFREMTAKRKAMKWWPNPLNRAFAKLISVLCGYGEKWHRVIISAAVVVLGLALVYFGFNSVWAWEAFWRSLYFSAVSFTALGYGGWVNETWIDINNNWIKGIGVSESFVGVFMMALFLVTFTRKMTR